MPLPETLALWADITVDWVCNGDADWADTRAHRSDDGIVSQRGRIRVDNADGHDPALHTDTRSTARHVCACAIGSDRHTISQPTADGRDADSGDLRIIGRRGWICVYDVEASSSCTSKIWVALRDVSAAAVGRDGHVFENDRGGSSHDHGGQNGVVG